MTHDINSNVKVLSIEVDPDEKEESEYRFLVDDQHVKYVTTDPGIFPPVVRTFAPLLIPILPPFPSGNWNQGHISKDALTGQLYFARTEKNDLARIQSLWHNTHIDHKEFKEIDRLRPNIHVVTHAQFEGSVVIKFAEFPWQIPWFEAETIAYEWIEGANVGPKFLGHLTEAGRGIGLIIEHIDGVETAGPKDLDACREILARLHSIGIKHGDINKFNFLVRGSDAVLVDFETCKWCDDEEQLDAEYRLLEQSLNDPSYKGGVRSF